MITHMRSPEFSSLPDVNHLNFCEITTYTSVFITKGKGCTWDHGGMNIHTQQTDTLTDNRHTA